MDEVFLEFEGTIDPSIDIPNRSQILIISTDQSYLTHGIHKFPAKFFPELPRYLITKYSAPTETVLDPMCGSGTVVLESLLNNRAAIGIDIDPIARLVTQVKTTPIDPELLRQRTDELLVSISKRANNGFSPHIPEFNYRDTWFRDFVLTELGIIKDSISDLEGLRREVRLFFEVSLSSIIRDVSNADPHCTRTVIRKKQVRDISPGDTIYKFTEVLYHNLGAMVALNRITKTTENWSVYIPEGSATATSLEDASVDLAVTSPPYINAVDYPRTHQLELYWLGLVDDGPLSRMKRHYIGTEVVYKNEYQDLKVSGYSELDPLLEQIYSRDPRRSYIVYKFFQDMELQLRETYRVLRPGGHYCLAIGNNTIRGILVESHMILTEIATSDAVGFELDRMFFSGVIRHFIRIPRKERMPGEWVLILRKPE